MASSHQRMFTICGSESSLGLMSFLQIHTNRKDGFAPCSSDGYPLKFLVSCSDPDPLWYCPNPWQSERGSIVQSVRASMATNSG